LIIRYIIATAARNSQLVRIDRSGRVEIVIVIGEIVLLARTALTLAGGGGAGGHGDHRVIPMGAGDGGEGGRVRAAAAAGTPRLHAVGRHLPSAQVGEGWRINAMRGSKGATGRSSGVGRAGVSVIGQRGGKVQGRKTKTRRRR